MNRLISLLVLSFFPALLCAEGALNFAPPPGDYSVVFLGNIFGVVDGVLHGTGSQIMGSMFSVFNSAVMALGGMVIMYTLMVSTMNTAHEGQMLGQKWSSIWIPVRSTVGLALLIPKASGYCMMQVFVMWVTVQGVGAADKVWAAALSYMNRGGAIIQVNVSANDALDKMVSPSAAGVPNAAMVMLAGQVCMLGLQKQLEAKRQYYQNASNSDAKGSKPCDDPGLKVLCDNAIPDFIGSVNAVTTQSTALQNAKAALAKKMKGGARGERMMEESYDKGKLFADMQFSMPMPNISSGPYADLNGICGLVSWNSLSGALAPPKKSSILGRNVPSASVNLSSSELETAQMSRAIAIQQMYMDLSTVAQVIVNNNPLINTNPAVKSQSLAGASENFAPNAKLDFGVPYTSSNVPCTKYSEGCTNWGPTPGWSGGVLFSGTEFVGSIMDYKAIMTPTLRLIRAQQNTESANANRAFISGANQKGWILAGAYFYDLVKLSGNAASIASLEDKDTGLERSTFDSSKLTSLYSSDPKNKLVAWFPGKNNPELLAVQAMIDGAGEGVALVAPSFVASPGREATEGKLASTVFGLSNNSVMIQFPGQPGLVDLKFTKVMSFTVNTKPMTMPFVKFPCGGINFVIFKLCVGRILGDIMYNGFFVLIYNAIMVAFSGLIKQVVFMFLMLPLVGMQYIFKQGITILNEPGANPIVALANMGVHYINFSGNLWLQLLGMTVTFGVMGAIPYVGGFVLLLVPLMAMGMPIVIAWVGVMTTIGFTTAYYVPLLPYIIFTLGAIGWFICVLEAMVAAPIVALGVTHPEGHDAFGKGEQALMILLNVFLRPSMMIIGFIGAIILSYVGVWLLSAGYDHAASYIQGGAEATKEHGGAGRSLGAGADTMYKQAQGAGSGATKYTEWAGIYAYFFTILTFTSLYLLIVQNAFSLIDMLPDKILRWIGGTHETIGEQTSKWADEAKQQSGKGADETLKGQGATTEKAGGYGKAAIAGAGAAAAAASAGKGLASAAGSAASTPEKK
jgi:defect-in-organelle-trafficking protein DotA